MLQYNKRLSDKYKCKLYLKREDLHEVRSFKIRGAYNKISKLNDKSQNKMELYVLVLEIMHKVLHILVMY